jgi:hypothetical protein
VGFEINASEDIILLVFIEKAKIHFKAKIIQSGLKRGFLFRSIECPSKLSDGKGVEHLPDRHHRQPDAWMAFRLSNPSAGRKASGSATQIPQQSQSGDWLLMSRNALERSSFG